MGKTPDSVIREIQVLVQKPNNLTVKKACKKFGISHVTYYSRLKAINEVEVEALKVKDRLNSTLVLDVPGIVDYLTTNIEELNNLKGRGDTAKDEAYIIEKQNKTLVELLNILQRFILNNTDEEIREAARKEVALDIYQHLRSVGLCDNCKKLIGSG